MLSLHKVTSTTLGHRWSSSGMIAMMQKYFHVLDTETRELTAIHNPITIYEKIYYDA
jgi:hypothetical protein